MSLPIDQTPLIRDQSAENLARALDAAFSESLVGGTREQLLRELSRQVVKPSPGPDGLLDPVTATGYLINCVEKLEKIIKRQIASYSAYRWLWYLRRCSPKFFAGKYLTTGGYDLSLAEALSSDIGTFGPPGKSKEFLTYPINDSVARHLLRYITATKMLSHFHVLLRYAGKGASFIPSGPIETLEPEVPSELEAAIRLYDRRTEREEGQLYSCLGIGEATVNDITIDNKADNSLMLLHGVKPMLLPVPVLDGADSVKTVRVNARYVPRFVSVESLLSVFSDTRTKAVPIGEEESALLVLLKIALNVSCNFKWSLVSLIQYGYFSSRPESILEACREYFDASVQSLLRVMPQLAAPKSLDHVFEILSREPASTWPRICGKVFHYQDNYACLDIAGVTKRLIASLEFPKITGGAANARAEVLELNMQVRIDGSRWCPPNMLRRLRGETLRIDGENITDIDAIGAKGETLLLVSCKSIPYSAEYNVGEYRAVRNAATTVDEAVVRWNEVCDTFKRTSKGNNFDFSMYNDIVGVVCTPFPVFTKAQLSLKEIIPTLRAASSFSEIGRWLKEDSDSV